jgi:hypothetical protein
MPPAEVPAAMFPNLSSATAPTGSKLFIFYVWIIEGPLPIAFILLGLKQLLICRRMKEIKRVDNFKLLFSSKFLGAFSTTMTRSEFIITAYAAVIGFYRRSTGIRSGHKLLPSISEHQGHSYLHW